MKWKGEEKRRFVRVNFPCKIIVHTPNEYAIHTYTENIGVGGIRVVIEDRLEISSGVGLEVYVKDVLIVCKGKVVWVLDKESVCHKGYFIYDTGIEFFDIKERDKQHINELVSKIISER